MFDLFSDFFAGRDNVLSRLDSRVKFISAMTLIGFVIISKKPNFPLFVMFMGLSGMLLIGIPIKLSLKRLLAPMSLVLGLVVIQTFITGSTSLFALNFLGHTITAKVEGLRLGILMGARVLGAVATLLLLTSVTPAYKIFHVLRWLKLPESCVEIALIVYRHIFVIIEQTAEVSAAQKSRLGYSTVRRSMNSAGILAGAVIMRSMDQAIRTQEAMTLRGYKGSMPFPPMKPMTWTMVGQLFYTVAVIVIFHLLLERHTF